MPNAGDVWLLQPKNSQHLFSKQSNWRSETNTAAILMQINSFLTAKNVRTPSEASVNLSDHLLLIISYCSEKHNSTSKAMQACIQFYNIYSFIHSALVRQICLQCGAIFLQFLMQMRASLHPHKKTQYLGWALSNICFLWSFRFPKIFNLKLEVYSTLCTVTSWQEQHSLDDLPESVRVFSSFLLTVACGVDVRSIQDLKYRE